ncbi:MAG: lipase, partial [Acutalibacteraceae bacterium]|nr:lipase [Acutalibacteraceae bacterium]
MYKKALTPRLMRTTATVPRMYVEKKNDFPIVLVHGAVGWGEDDLWNKFMRYYGFVRMDIPKMYRMMGIECCSPGLGPYNCIWDRACDLWAQLTGGTTDYGIVHSARYHHDRYGRTYDKPLIKDWGKLDDEGKRKKICLIAHSFGAPTIRAFMSILAEGSAEEREATPENELSEFFKGGKADWVHAMTTFA